MTVNGETASPPTASPPEIDAGLAAAALAVFAHRHEVVHLLYAATDEPDALARIADLLKIDESTITRVLDQPLRWMLPQFRAELETIAVSPASTAATRAAVPTSPASPALPGAVAGPVAGSGSGVPAGAPGLPSAGSAGRGPAGVGPAAGEAAADLEAAATKN